MRINYGLNSEYEKFFLLFFKHRVVNNALAAVPGYNKMVNQGNADVFQSITQIKSKINITSGGKSFSRRVIVSYKDVSRIIH